MSTFKADLHCHTTFSDGSLTPRELLLKAKESGLNGLSITDHDTIGAYSIATPLSQEIDLSLIPGVEFSAFHRHNSIHILGYAFDLRNPDLILFCKKHHQRREGRNQYILDKLALKNMPLTIDEVKKFSPNACDNIGRLHIAHALVQKGYINSVDEAFRYYIGENQLCYDSGDAVSVEETLDLIHRAQGLAIIAHPHLIKNQSIVQELLKMPFDGIEAVYARFGMRDNSKWIKIAQQKNWLITAGSDYHGPIKQGSSLGSSWVGEETFKILQELSKKNQAP